MFFAIFWVIRHCGLCDFQQLGYSYIRDEAVERILACVTKWKCYARILNTFCVSTNGINIAACIQDEALDCIITRVAKWMGQNIAKSFDTLCLEPC